MKTLRKSIFAVLALGLLLFGCQPDTVDPSGNGGGKVAGAFDAQHVALDTVCKYTDSIFFRSSNGSYVVDKCIGAGGVVIPCVAQQMKWGSCVMYNGYTGISTGQPVHWLDIDFSLAGGWMCDFTNWAFVISDGITIDPNTGIPVTTGSDWQSLVVNPYRNQWKVAIPVDSLPAGTFDMACRMTILRLKLNGTPNEPTRTTVWAINQHWNETNSEWSSNNEFAIRYTPLGCLPSACPTTITNSVCESVYTGITCTGNTMNTTTLTADSTGAGANATYLWSNGAMTRTISVAPTTTTSYNVTVSKGACAIRTTTFDVNVIDASCVIGGNGGGNGSGHGQGNGGGHNGSHGSNGHNGSNGHSGGSGSHHHPGCSHNHNSHTACNGGNHRYGCNTQHSGGNSNCNHKGHGYHCTRSHASNKSCNGGHTMGCDGNHATNVSCQSRGGHKYNCNGAHTSGNCNNSIGHTPNCSMGNHSGYTACNNGHSHSHHGNGSGRGQGSGHAGGHEQGHSNGSGACGSGGNTGNGGGAPGVKVCHVPPGNPNGATTVCVSVAQLNSHVTGVCGGNGGGGNGGNGSGNGGSSNGSGNGSGHGNGGSNHGGGNHGSAPNCGNGHNSGNHSGCTHNNSHPANCGQGHNSGQHSQCSHTGGGNSGSNGSGGHGAHGGGAHGCGHGNPSGGHTGDYIGGCNTNPCN